MVAPASELAFLCRALKAPSLAAAAARLAERARTESWSHEEYLAACLDREVSARRLPAAAFRPARPSRSSTSNTSARCAATSSPTSGPSTSWRGENVVFLGPLGMGKTVCPN